MTENTSYADIVLLALIAGFILLRLRSVLGQDVGADSSSFFRKDEHATAMQAEPIVEAIEKIAKHKPKEEPDQRLEAITNSAITEAVAAIKAKDASFNLTIFTNGAKMAYEMVFDAFNKSDKDTLKILLSESCFKEFSDAMDARSKEEHAETTLVSVTPKDIPQATLTGNMARISVKFLCEQVTVTRDKDGKIVAGNPSEVHHAEDEWTFERDITSKNPNWKIIET